jgi:hypothetical protein
LVAINQSNFTHFFSLQGLIAKDTFHVSYGGAALNRSMSQVTTVLERNVDVDLIGIYQRL